MGLGAGGADGDGLRRRRGARLEVGLGLRVADGGDDGFLVTLDAATGAPLTGRNFPGTATESGSAVTVDPFGATILGGSFSDRVTVGGSTYSSSFTGRADAFLVRAAD